MVENIFFYDPLYSPSKIEMNKIKMQEKIIKQLAKYHTSSNIAGCSFWKIDFNYNSTVT